MNDPKFEKGEIVELDLAGYDAWYVQNVSTDGCKFRTERVRISYLWDDDHVGIIELDGYTWCGRVPIQFVKRNEDKS